LGSNAAELLITAKLALSLLLGAAVGLEREAHDRPAGLRTFILVSVGSTLIMIVSLGIRDLFPGLAGIDPGRIAAQVVTGIGFLGAGTILHEGASIRGLTTAAGLWVVAAVGLAVGAGFYLAAASGTVLTLITLTVLSYVERNYIGGKGYATLEVTARDEPGQLGRVGSTLGEQDIDIRDIRLIPEEPDRVLIRLRVKVSRHGALEEAMQRLATLPGVYSAEYSQRDS